MKKRYPETPIAEVVGGVSMTTSLFSASGSAVRNNQVNGSYAEQESTDYSEHTSYFLSLFKCLYLLYFSWSRNLLLGLFEELTKLFQLEQKPPLWSF